MFPLRDENPSYGIPVAVISLILINIAVFLWQLNSPDDAARYMLVPAMITHRGVVAGNIGWPAIFTSMFMHHDVWHILGNMWFLWLFGDNIEWVMGRGRFLLFYLLCGVVAAYAQILMSPGSEIAMVGASGAIAGVLAIYMITYPAARVLTLVALFFYWRVIAIPALVWVGIWMLMQVIGIGVMTAMGAVGGVAYAAHIGGFAAGAILGPFLRIPARVVHQSFGASPQEPVIPRRGFTLNDEIERQRHEKGQAIPSYGVPALDDMIRKRRYAQARAVSAAMLNESLRTGNERTAAIYQSYLNLLRTLE